METSKIKLKNNASMTGVIMMMLLVMTVFTAGFLYIQNNATRAGITVDSKYNQSFTQLSTAQDNLSDTVTSLQHNLNNITEASSVYQVAWNGLKGLGNALKLPIEFMSVALRVWTAMVPGMDMLPGWLSTIIFIAITAFIVLLILSILKGEPKLSD